MTATFDHAPNNGAAPKPGGQDAVLEKSERLTALLANQLSAAEASAVRAELAANPELQQEFARLSETWQLCAALAPVAPSQALESSLLNQIQALPIGQESRAMPAPSAKQPEKLGVVISFATHVAGPLMMAAALLIGVSVLIMDPNTPAPERLAKNTMPEKASPADAKGNSALADGVARQPGAPVAQPAPQDSARAKEVQRLDDNSKEPANPLGDMVSGPLAPEPLNPGGEMVRNANGPLAPEPLNPVSYRSRQGDGEWQPLPANASLSRLNVELAVRPGQVVKLNIGPATVHINGGETGAQLALVADPTAGTDDKGNPKGAMLELLKPAQVFVDMKADSEKALAVRTPSALAVVKASAAEIGFDSAGATRLAVARGSVELAGLIREGGVAAAVVQQGEMATINLLGRPEVRRNLNASWVGNWTRLAASTLDARVEQPFQAGVIIPKATERGAVGSLVASGPDFDQVPLVINDHNVSVRIVDQIAVTTIEEIFENTTDRTLEGTFYFPLPADAAISEFAMWIRQLDGKVEKINGEFVERQRARRIYEEYKYQRRDPALLEWQDGNQFQMSIFPIMPREQKRLRLTYTQLLAASGNTVRYVYPLVSEKLKGNPVRRLRLNVEVAGENSLESARSLSHLMALTGTNAAAWRGGFDVTDYTPGRDFILECRLKETSNALNIRAHKPSEESKGTFAGFFAPVFAAPAASERQPGRTVILADTSGSMNNSLFALQLAALEQILKRLPGEESFTVIAYDTLPRPVIEGFVPATPEQQKVALAALAASQRFGSTNLKLALKYVLANCVKPGEATTVILLGDGIPTQGEVRGGFLAKELAALHVGQTGKTLAAQNAVFRLIPVALGNTIDEDVLNALATEFDGKLIRATADRKPEEIAAELSRQMVTPLLTDLQVSISGDFALENLMPASYPAIATGETISFAARYAKAGKGAVTFTGRVAGKTVSWTYPLELPAAGADMPEVVQFWAKRAIDGAQARIDLNDPESAKLREQIVKLSTEFKVSSRHTSLLVLETGKEFERWQIDRENDAISKLKVDTAGKQPGLTLTQSRGDVQIQPEGSDVWVPARAYIEKHGRVVSLNAKIYVGFNASAVVAGPNGEPISLSEKATLRGLDLPGASAALAEWAKAQAQPVAPVPPQPEAVAVSAEFKARAETLLAQIKAIREAWLNQERERVRAEMKADLDAARTALQEFDTLVGAEMKTEQQKKAHQEQAEVFKQLLAPEIDPLAAWQTLREYVARLGLDAAKFFKKSAGDDAKWENKDKASADELAKEDEGGRLGSALEGRREFRGPSESGEGQSLGDVRRLEELQRAMQQQPQNGAAAHGGANGGARPGGDLDAPATGRTAEPNANPAPRPNATNAPQQPGEPPRAASPAQDPGAPAPVESRPSNRAERADAPRDANAADGRNADGESRLATDSESDSGAMDLPSATEGALRGRAEFARRTGGREQGGAAEELEAEKSILALKPESKLAEGEALRKTLDSLKAADPALQKLSSEVFDGWIKRQLGMADNLDSRFASLLPPRANVVPMSVIIKAYTQRVLAQVRAPQAPKIADIQFGPEGAKLHQAMSAKRAASIKDQQEKDRRWQQAENGITVFALDCSYTMSEKLTAAQLAALVIADPKVKAQIKTKFDLARYELLNALGSLTENERFAVILFSRDVFYLHMGGSIVLWRPETGYEKAAHRASAGTIGFVARVVSHLVPDETSNLPGLIKSLHSEKLFDKTAPELGRTVYLLTDGWASWSPDSTGFAAGSGLGNGASLADYAKSTFNRDFATAQEKLTLFIHPVGVGEHDAAYLAEMARQTGGTYLDATGGNNSGKKLADETPAQRISRKTYDLRGQAKNEAAWKGLVDWAKNIAKDEKATLSTYLAWAEVHPTAFIIYEELGEWLEKLNRKDDALRAYTTVVETGYANAETHRYLGNFYRARNNWEAARDEYRIARTQAWYVAIAYFNEANAELHLGNHAEAQTLYGEILDKETKWPARYRNIEERARRELIVVYQQLRRAAEVKGDAKEVERLSKLVASTANTESLKRFVNADLIVTLDWDTDGTDVDLWLLRNGKDNDKCYYERMDAWGAKLHEDQTEGFGPEYITLPKGDMAAEYQVKVHYYSTGGWRLRSFGHARVITFVGTGKEQVWEYHFKLDRENSVFAAPAFKLEKK